MTLSLKQSNAITALADLLYDFLPGSGSPRWRGHVSFKTVAAKVGVGDFCQAGSKLPMIATLLECTLENRRNLFERLILEIVRAGITYRQKRNDPIKPEEIEKLNGHLLELGFKFRQLWDPELRDALRLDSGQRAKKRVEQALREQQVEATAIGEHAAHISQLKDAFFTLHAEEDRQAAGYALEKLLNCLFALEGLEPTESFRVIGEQIDGAFELDHEAYLVEARWEQRQLSEAPLLTFRGKIEGKSPYTRGVFIAINGVTEEAKRAITIGKQPTFFIVDGYDLTMILSEDVDLKEFLRQRQRLLAERGAVVVAYKDLWTR
jgi:hypothetical protein